jgi:hypothetical protein
MVIGDGVAAGVGDDVAAGVGEAVAGVVGVEVDVGLGVWPSVAVAVAVGASVGLAAGTGLAVAGTHGVALGLGASLGSALGDELESGVGATDWRGRLGLAFVGSGVGGDVSVALGDGVGAAVDVGLGGVGTTLGVAAGTGSDAVDWATGLEFIHVSATLSFVSTALPAAPPGRRSRLHVAAGVRPGVPSTNELDASPQLNESMTLPPTARSTRLPPVALKPPE